MNIAGCRMVNSRFERYTDSSTGRMLAWFTSDSEGWYTPEKTSRQTLSSWQRRRQAMDQQHPWPGCNVGPTYRVGSHLSGARRPLPRVGVRKEVVRWRLRLGKLWSPEVNVLPAAGLAGLR